MQRSPPPRSERARGEAIGLLAVALRPPADPGELAACLEGLRQRVRWDPDAYGWVDAAARLARDTQMEREYHRLFLGPAPPVAPPFASVYRDGRAFGPASVEFLRELREAGFEPVADIGVPPDHVCLELEYLAELEFRVAYARDSGRHAEAAEWAERANTFVDRHLARWLPAFVRRLEAGAPGSPYTFLARTAARVVGVETEGVG